jgi:PhnB protein
MAKTRAIPEDKEGIIPHLVVRDAATAIEFYKKAFGAEEVMRLPAPDGRVLHAALAIGGTHVFLADDFPEWCGGKSRHPTALGGTPVTLHQYVNDVDAAIRRAQSAGATVKMPADDMFWGDRYGVIEDPFGHQWSLATHTRDVTPEEMSRAAKQMFSAPPAAAAKSGSRK